MYIYIYIYIYPGTISYHVLTISTWHIWPSTKTYMAWYYHVHFIYDLVLSIYGLVLNIYGLVLSRADYYYYHMCQYGCLILYIGHICPPTMIYQTYLAADYDISDIYTPYKNPYPVPKSVPVRFRYENPYPVLKSIPDTNRVQDSVPSMKTLT